MKTYVLTDIHGMMAYLRKALAWIETDADGKAHRVIFLGDYVDRGPDSADVVEMISHGPKHWFPLRGNHEEMFLHSYHEGILHRRLPMEAFDRATAQSYSYTKGGVMERHVDWMETLPRIMQDDKRIYVHAGLRLGVPIADQNPSDLIWIREEFMYGGQHDFGKLVVHGHTPESNRRPPYFYHQRLNLDTGAPFRSGRLSVGVFDDDAPHPRVYQVSSYTEGVLHWNEAVAIWDKKDLNGDDVVVFRNEKQNQKKTT